MSDQDIYVTRAEAAAILHCSPETVARYARRGRLTRYRRGGTQTVIYLRDEVLNLVRPAHEELVPDEPAEPANSVVRPAQGELVLDEPAEPAASSAVVRPARGALRMRTVGKVQTLQYRDIN